MKKFLLAWTLALTAIAAAAKAFGAAPDFDQASPRPEAASAAAADQGVWVSFDRSDMAKAKAFPLSSPVMADSATALFKVAPSMLPVLSEFMHDHFQRCAGFFAYRTKAKAQAAMALRAASAASAVSYTLDQQAVVTPLMPRVKEANLQATISGMAAFNNRYYTSDTGVQAAKWLQGRWQEIAAKIPGASVSLFAHEGWSQPSVILTIPGSETPDEIVVLGGHLDSINGWGDDAARAPGADDNASGIAVLTDTARLLAESGFRPKRTIQFMGYAAEEVGLRGSQDIAAQYASSGKKVVGVIQYDMSNFKGSDEEIFLLTDHVDAGLSAFTGKLIDTYVKVKRSTTECGYACSDHASWESQGFPAAMAFEASFDGMNHAIHTERDTLATSGGDASHSVPFTKLAVAFAVELGKSAGGARMSGAAAAR
jgi:bacterial leucyl aminopeptidase